ncbi:MAG TPA: DUF2625 family protein [Myxococcaceae bacterium]|jgi:hypothetical protein|nr:DUF2625 family protein [Myxococcaceae bacterium]
MRELSELIQVDEPAWPMVQAWIAAANKPVEVLPRDPPRAEEAVVKLQVTTNSVLGAIAWETGGVLIDSGWIRVLGSGCARMNESLITWNHGDATAECVFVAFDVLGGVFALDGGALGHGQGDAFYFAPESLDWEQCDCGYPGLLQFLLISDLEKFYAGSRWPGWREEVARLSPDQGLALDPAPWTAEGKDLSRASRAPVPIRELVARGLQASRQLAGDAR